MPGGGWACVVEGTIAPAGFGGKRPAALISSKTDSLTQRLAQEVERDTGGKRGDGLS